VEIVFVEPASPQTGVLVVPVGNRMQGQASRYQFIAGYLDPRRYRQLSGVRFRTCSAEGEWLNRLVDSDLVPGRKPEPKLQHDMRLLQSLIPEPRRRELLDAHPTRWATGRLYP
jgi:hypothetical protein